MNIKSKTIVKRLALLVLACALVFAPMRADAWSVNVGTVTLSQDKLLALLGKATESTATKFDKVMDSEYLLTHIGGSNHRLFDGGHTLGGAWNKIDAMCAGKCSLAEQMKGYTGGLWKDVTTPKGLPFANLSPESYNKLADNLSKMLGVKRQWVYDALSYDALEVVAAGLSAFAVIYHLDNNDLQKASQILGGMAITSIVSANPLMGLVVIGSVAYMVKTGKKVDKGKWLKGAGLSGAAFAGFALLSAPLLLEIGVVMAVVILLDKYTTADNLALVKNYTLSKIKEAEVR
ncbi:MAG: hypothetical protein OXF42_03305 [Candidatus Dadabacteria bacterium]|nr:hypothetical protein [Candidatus Dadabacteria bacterium]